MYTRSELANELLLSEEKIEEWEKEIERFGYIFPYEQYGEIERKMFSLAIELESGNGLHESRFKYLAEFGLKRQEEIDKRLSVFPDNSHDFIKTIEPYYVKEEHYKSTHESYETKETPFYIQRFNIDVREDGLDNVDLFSMYQIERKDEDGEDFIPEIYQEFKKFLSDDGIIINFRVIFELERYFPFLGSTSLYKENRKFEILYHVYLFPLSESITGYKTFVCYTDNYNVFEKVFYKKYRKESIYDFEQRIIDKALKKTEILKPFDEETSNKYFTAYRKYDFGIELD